MALIHQTSVEVHSSQLSPHEIQERSVTHPLFRHASACLVSGLYDVQVRHMAERNISELPTEAKKKRKVNGEVA